MKVECVGLCSCNVELEPLRFSKYDYLLAFCTPGCLLLQLRLPSVCSTNVTRRMCSIFSCIYSENGHITKLLRQSAAAERNTNSHVTLKDSLWLLSGESLRNLWSWTAFDGRKMMSSHNMTLGINTIMVGARILRTLSITIKTGV